jgi:hypothetical protein
MTVRSRKKVENWVRYGQNSQNQYFTHISVNSQLFCIIQGAILKGIHRGIRPYTKDRLQPVATGFFLCQDWVRPRPRPVSTQCNCNQRSGVKWEGIFNPFTPGGTETVPSGRVVHLSFVQSNLITLELWVCTVSLWYEQRSVLQGWLGYLQLILGYNCKAKVSSSRVWEILTVLWYDCKAKVSVSRVRRILTVLWYDCRNKG